MTDSKRPIALLATSLMLTACGGGGDGGSLAPPPADAAAITTANAPTIAGAVVVAALEGEDLGTFASPSASTATAAAAKASNTGPVQAKVAQLTAAHVNTVIQRTVPDLLQVVIDAETSPCTLSGTVTLSGNVANTSTLTPGDTLVFEFDQCAEPDATVDGSFSMTVTSFSGDLVSGSFSFGVTVELSDFATIEDGAATTANGDLSLSIDATSAPMLTTTVGSDSLTILEAGGSHTLSDYLLTQALDGASGFTLDASGALTSSVFAGTVTFETTAALQGTGSGFAFTGEILITGAGGGTITLTVLDATTCRLEVDVDGDGMLEATIDTTWDDLI